MAPTVSVMASSASACRAKGRECTSTGPIRMAKPCTGVSPASCSPPTRAVRARACGGRSWRRPTSPADRQCRAQTPRSLKSTVIPETASACSRTPTLFAMVIQETTFERLFDAAPSGTSILSQTSFGFESNRKRHFDVTVPGSPRLEQGMTVAALLEKPND